MNLLNENHKCKFKVSDLKTDYELLPKIEPSPLPESREAHLMCSVEGTAQSISSPTEYQSSNMGEQDLMRCRRSDDKYNTT